jgi:hypothetical protein
MITAKIIADSVSEEGKRLTTMQLTYPRFTHAEFMTHRVFSRNASSSRAIPVAKMIEQVRTNPAMPTHWGKNQSGMQANEELHGSELWQAREVWKNTANMAANCAETMMNLGLHKQVANRILEPFQHIHVVVTATEWDNFFELRAHKDAQPEIQMLAVRMMAALGASTPKLLLPQQWHLPYVTCEDFAAEQYLMNPLGVVNSDHVIELAKKVSAARCCRVSYLKHDGTNSSIEEDLKLCDRLAGAEPIHASPFEHQATPDTLKHGLVWKSPHLHGNFVGWIQHRKLIEYKFGELNRRDQTTLDTQ